MRAEQPRLSVFITEMRAQAQRVCPALAKVVLLLPFLLLPFTTRALADYLASRAATSIATLANEASALSAPVDAPSSNAQDAQDARDGSEASVHLDLDIPYVQGIEVLPRPSAAAFAEADAASSTKSRRGLSGLSGPRGGILVREALVAQAVRSGARPSGSPVPAIGLRPAGILLAGVSGFGSGLRDGDVLTTVSGVPATSVAAVIGAVSGALSKHAPVITGEVWRGDTRLAVAVEIPTMTKPDVATPKRGSPPRRVRRPSGR